MRSLISHLRYTVRLLLRSPGFTITAVLIFGRGIGANTAIFSLVNTVLLKPLPYPHADRLVSIYEIIHDFDKAQLDYPDYIDFRKAQQTFDGLTAYYSDDFTITGSGEPERISGLYAPGSLFKVLGRPFLLGAPFGETEDGSEKRAVAVISEHLWNTRFHRDPNVLGKTLSLDGRNFEIVGVTPPQANEWVAVDVYVPLNLSSYFRDIREIRSEHFLWAIGRLKEDVSLQQATANLETINRELSTQYPDAHSRIGVQLIPYLSSVINDYSASLWVLEAAVSCLLIVTCANVANLLLTRVQERRTEITIRAALGAAALLLAAVGLYGVLSYSVNQRKRELGIRVAVGAQAWNIFHLIITQGLLTGAAGLVFGLVGALVFARFIQVALYQVPSIDPPTLIAAAAVLLLTALMACLLPALRATRIDPIKALRE